MAAHPALLEQGTGKACALDLLEETSRQGLLEGDVVADTGDRQLLLEKRPGGEPARQLTGRPDACIGDGCCRRGQVLAGLVARLRRAPPTGPNPPAGVVEGCSQEGEELLAQSRGRLQADAGEGEARDQLVGGRPFEGRDLDRRWLRGGLVGGKDLEQPDELFLPPAAVGGDVARPEHQRRQRARGPSIDLAWRAPQSHNYQ